MADVLIILGSPRRQGDTNALATEAARGLSDRKKSSEIIFLNDLHFSGCQACYACKREDSTNCTHNDDMQLIYRALENAGGVIVATPIYFGSVTGQTKLWLDRLFPYLSMNLGSLLPRKIPLSCIYTQNQPDASLFTGSMDTFEYMLRILGFDVRSRMVAPDLDIGTKTPASERKDLMDQAYGLGYQLFPFPL